jgi:RimJ/RimL family protein N-acetyltransferase
MPGFDKSILDHIPLQGDSVLLRKFRLKDAESVYNMVRDQTILRNLNLIRLYKPEYAIEFVRKSQYRQRTINKFIFCIEDIKLGNHVGTIGLHHILHRHKTGRIGYWIGKPYWRKGYASDAVRTLCRFAFSALKLHHLSAEVFEFNQPSMKLLESLGWTAEVVLRKAELINRGYYDIVRYGLLASEFV